MSARLTRWRGQGGFTLIEAIVVIAITGIIGGIVAVFIKLPVQSYVDSAARAELTDIADTALRRIARDVRVALPNSIRLGGTAQFSGIEFLPTKTGGRYLAAEDGQASTAKVLDFVNGDLYFTVVGPMPAAPLTITPGTDSIVVYNLGTGFGSSDAYASASTTANVAAVDAVNGQVITLKSNPFSSQSPAMGSPGRRFQVITTPVMYGCNLAAKTLTRYSNYPISATINVPPVVPPGYTGMVSALIATNVTACGANYVALANTHSALLGINLTLQRPNTTETVTLSHQVHVDNVP